MTDTIFNYSGNDQFYTVPAGVTTLGLDLSAGQGGYHHTGDDTTFGIPGLGGRIITTLPVTPGELLKVMVGGRGWNGDESGVTDWNYGWGGPGVTSDYSTHFGSSGGGGGLTGIWRLVSAGPPQVWQLIVAAGGGGGAAGPAGTSRGGDGGTGGSSSGGDAFPTGGKGGKLGSGTGGLGGGRDTSIGGNLDGGDGSLWKGGRGGAADNVIKDIYWCGGGGGGGFAGGGGGGCGSVSHGGGGGGAGSSGNSFDMIPLLSADRVGNGIATITATGLPPLRFIQRDDYLGGGAPRVVGWGPTSRQNSIRQGWGDTYV